MNSTLSQPTDRKFEDLESMVNIPGVLTDLIEVEKSNGEPITMRIAGSVIAKHVTQNNEASAVRKLLTEKQYWRRQVYLGKLTTFTITAAGKSYAKRGSPRLDADAIEKIIVSGTSEIAPLPPKGKRRKRVTLDDFPDVPIDEELPPEVILR